jgi:chemotaxis response regulator CheB
MECQSTQEPIRIILAMETRLLREMLRRAISKSPHMEVVREVSGGTDLPSMVKETKADWVLILLRSDGKLPLAAKRLLEEQPSVSIIALAPDGGEVRLAWANAHSKVTLTGCDGHQGRLRPTESHQTALRDLSLSELMAVLRKGSPWEHAIQDLERTSVVEYDLSEKE